jgi:hypothetical protein
VIQVSGTHREVSQQIGEKVKYQLQRILPRLRENLPPGVSWENMLLKGRLCLAHSRAVYPQFVEELEGIAEAAELPFFEEVFVAIYEELTVTVFSIISLNELRAYIGRGRPCQTTYISLTLRTDDQQETLFFYPRYTVT